jgi:membrane fusion protein, copper/silver efflux system
MTDNDNTTRTDGATRAAPRHRYSLGTIVLVALLSSAVVGALGYWLSGLGRPQHPAGGTTQAPQALYQCPMHPSIMQDHPGECPICGMKLVKVEPGRGGVTGAGGDHTILYYRSPMDPRVTSHTPQKDELGMDYVPVYADELTGGQSTVPGEATVEIDPARQQLIGLTTAEVSAGPVGGSWRTVGTVAMDETRERHINLKVSGFVERAYVDYVGKSVKRGDPLFALYSPELLSAQEEYLLALRTREALSQGGALKSDGDALVKAARRRLLLWDVPEAEIDRIARTGEASKTLTFYSPVAGVVTKKDVVEGMKLDAGAMPYEIVDLSEVWVLVDVYENELQYVHTGMPATLTLNAFPNREFKGTVLFIDPLLDPQTRTVKVRLALPNPGGELRPEMFGDVVLSGKPHEGLRIPLDALVDSGTEKIVFVALGNGKFQPRIVRLGEASGTIVEVLSGLKAGEQVVTRANFLIDSESRLQASLAEMSAGNRSEIPEHAHVLPGGESEQASPSEKPPADQGGGPAPGNQGQAR